MSKSKKVLIIGIAIFVVCSLLYSINDELSKIFIIIAAIDFYLTIFLAIIFKTKKQKNRSYTVDFKNKEAKSDAQKIETTLHNSENKAPIEVTNTNNIKQEECLNDNNETTKKLEKINLILRNCNLKNLKCVKSIEEIVKYFESIEEIHGFFSNLDNDETLFKFLADEEFDFDYEFGYKFLKEISLFINDQIGVCVYNMPIKEIKKNEKIWFLLSQVKIYARCIRLKNHKDLVLINLKGISTESFEGAMTTAFTFNNSNYIFGVYSLDDF